MDVRQFVPLIIEKIQANDDAIKHADGRHGSVPFRVQLIWRT
jgi:hypothetical protein